MQRRGTYVLGLADVLVNLRIMPSMFIWHILVGNSSASGNSMHSCKKELFNHFPPIADNTGHPYTLTHPNMYHTHTHTHRHTHAHRLRVTE